MKSKIIVSRTVTAIVSMVQRTLNQLHPLIEVGRVMICEMSMGPVFADMVHGQLNVIFFWLNDLLTAFVEPSRDSREMNEISKCVSLQKKSSEASTSENGVQMLPHRVADVNL